MKKKRWNIKRSLKFLMLFILLFFIVGDQSIPALTQAQMKTMLFLRMPNDLDWPEETGIKDKTKPFIIKIINTDPFERNLEQIISGKLLLNKKVKIQYIREVEQIPGAHMLFITEMGKKKLDEILEYTRYKPILTVSDTEGYATQGVIINLMMESFESKYTLEVNEGAARRAGFLLHPNLKTRNDIIKPVNPYNEYREKALQVDKIAKYVTWPPETGIDNQNSNFVITVIGDNEFGANLQKIFSVQKINNKPVSVRVVSNTNEIGDTHILFISRSKKDELSDIVSSVKKKPVLLIADTEGFAQKGVHIAFYYDGAKLCLEINHTAAKECGIQIGYQLSQFPGARVVESR